MTSGGMRFNRKQVERIIARAVEAEADETESFSTDDVVRIASELGVAPEEVSAAIALELSTSHSTTRRGLIPGEIAAARLIQGDPSEVAARTREWLGKAEGMRVRRRHGELEVWEKDPRTLANIRAGLGLNAGGKDLRGTGAIEVVHTPVPGGVNVSMRSSGSYQRGAAAGILGGFGLVGMGGATALTIAASQPWAWIYLFLPLLVIGAIVAVAAPRVWTNNVEGAMERALDAIAGGPPPSTDSVVDVINDIRETFTKRSDTRRRAKGRTIDL